MHASPSRVSQAETVQEPEAVNSPAASHPAASTDEWYNTVQSLSLSGLPAELAKNCILAEQDDQRIELHLETASEMLMRTSAIDEIEAALNEHFGTNRKLVVAVRELNQETPAQYNARYIKERQRAAEQNINDDSFIKALTERFDGKVVPGSVVPKTD